MHRFAILIALSVSVVPASGAGMARIVDIVDSHTVIIEERGARSSVRLAGVGVPRTDEAVAADFLRRTVASGWVLVERDADRPGEAWLYRSPDGLSVNGEMIRAAYLQGGTRMTYLGEASPGPHREAAPARRSAPKAEIARPRPRPPRRIRR
jgi:hypothetical protein